jgi:hypothetical protein
MPKAPDARLLPKGPTEWVLFCLQLAFLAAAFVCYIALGRYSNWPVACFLISMCFAVAQAVVGRARRAKEVSKAN